MNKTTLAQIQATFERALQALETLEAALAANDNRKIGATLYELRREMNKLQTLLPQDEQP